MFKLTISQRIQQFNQGRDPERLALKYATMRKDVFKFFRGTSHLFYQDWPSRSSLNKTPPAWICGDLHLENFGSYKGDNRLVYFDLNDFDEGALAPCGWDLARFLSSLWLGAECLSLTPDSAMQLCRSFLEAYSFELSVGKARWIERATARGMIRELLKDLKKRDRKSFIDKRTEWCDGTLQLRVDGKHALAARPAERTKITSLIQRFARTQNNPEFFGVLDVARRVGGLASLGLERYVVLIHGKGGGTEGNYLLDLKLQPGSVLSPYVKLPQPCWKNQAERVMALQSRGQAIAPAFLNSITLGKRAFVLRELMPSQDRLDLEDYRDRWKRLEAVVEDMGRLVAWSHLRSAGRQGSATADEWIAFGRRRDWHGALLEYAQTTAAKARIDWVSFCAEST